MMPRVILRLIYDYTFSARFCHVCLFYSAYRSTRLNVSLGTEKH